MMTDPWPRTILHADMDAFFAAVEQRDDPSLRGKPVIVGGLSQRGVVSTASYEARVFGIHSAMPMAEARKRCPKGIFLVPNGEKIRQASQAIMTVFESFSPLVEPLSSDEAFLDMTGTHSLFGTPPEMAQRIKERVKETTGGLKVSVGAGPNKFVAKVASDFQKPDGLTVVPPTEVRDFLDPLPISRLWGVGTKTEAKLRELGLTTIVQVAQMPLGSLRAHIGSMADHLRALARGEDDRPVIPFREAKSIGAECTLEEDVIGQEAIRPHLRRCASRVARQLRKKGVVARGVRVKLKTHTFKLWTRQTTLPSTDLEKELFHAAMDLLHEFDLSIPMRLVGMAAFALISSEAPQQQDLFTSGETARQSRLERTLDEVRVRFGKKAIVRAEELPSTEDE